MRDDPDWSSIPPDTPMSLRTLLRRCLEKDPNLRLHDVADVRIEMQDPSTVVTSSSRPGWSSGKLVAGILATIAVSVSLGVLLARYFDGDPNAQPVVSTLEIAPGYCLPGEDTTMRRPTHTAMAIAGDGRYVVYEGVLESAGTSRKSQLFRRWLNRASAEPIPGTEGASAPFLSPDGRWIGFWADNRLMKVLAEGGLPQVIGEFARPLGPSNWGATWGSDGTIVFSPYEGRGLYRISSAGGEISKLTFPDPKQKEFSHRLPFWLPTGKALLFTIMRFSRDLHPQVAILRLETGQWRVLLDDAADARYVPTGHLVVVRRGVLMAIPFDVKNLELTGPAVPLLSNVMQALNAPISYDNAASAQFSVSASGSLVYVNGGVLPDFSLSLVTVDPKNPERRVQHLTGPLYSFRLSPDGRTIAYVRGGLAPGVGIFDPERGIVTLLHEGWSYCTAWTPDGKQLAYELMQPGGNHLVVQPVDKSSGPVFLTEGLSCPHPGSWSPDGKVLAFV